MVYTEKVMTYKKAFWTIMAVLALIIAALASFLFFKHTSLPLPADVESKLTFSPFVPANGNKRISISGSTVTKLENGTQLLTYTLRMDDTAITVTQSVQPTQFTDIPQYKEQFLSNIINQYASFQTSNGTIYLGRVVKQNNKQVGIIVERGLLVFLNPNQDLSESQWRTIGDALAVQATAH